MLTLYGTLCKVCRMASVRSLQPTLWRTCRVLANRTRLRMFHLLLHQPGQTVSAIAERLGLTVPVASQNLRALEARGLLALSRSKSPENAVAGVAEDGGDDPAGDSRPS